MSAISDISNGSQTNVKADAYSNIIYLNIQGLHHKSNNTKINYLNDLVAERNNNIAIVLTETQLQPEIMDSELKISGYTLYRKDRLNRSHGGVAIYVNDNIVSHHKSSFSNGVCEYISVLLNINNKNIELSSLYRPPDTNYAEFDEVVCFILDEVKLHPMDCILLGDFNFPNINWKESSVSNLLFADYSGQQALKLKELTDKLFMTQFINRPTRKMNILDLLYTNNQNLIQSIDVVPTIYSDHNVINIETNIVNVIKPPCYEENILLPLKNVNIYSTNFENVNKTLSTIDWKKELTDKDPSECYNYITEIIVRLVTLNSKLKNKRKKISQEFRNRKILWRRRKKLEKKLKENPLDNELVRRISEIENEIKDLYEKEEKRNEMEAIQKIKSNCKYFYSYAKRTTISGTSIVKLEDKNGCVKTDREEICNVLQDQYVSVFSSPAYTKDCEIPNSDHNVLPNNSEGLDSIDFNVMDIMSAINDIPNNSAPGPDGITPKILKECKETLSYPLSLMWRKSLDLGIIPKPCKLSYIVPIHKKGKKDKPENYRPISLTSQLIKLFERIIKKQLVNYLESNNLIGNFQHGFRKNRSCLTQLVSHYTKVFDYINSGYNVDVVYLDFARAFDKVDHMILLMKAKALNITGKLLDWLKCFLLERTQSVVLEGFQSEEKLVKSGVPQGTVLAPLLFIIMINDLPDVLKHCSLSSFADDTKIVKTIKDVSDELLMTEDLNSIFKWSTENKLPFNCNKFTLLQYQSKGSQTITEHNYLTPDGDKIEKVDHVRDLGVIMSSNLNFKDHMTHIISKCKQLTGWLFRSFKTRDKLPMLTLWKSLILSRLDYCSQLWAPIKVGEMQDLEALQRTFTNSISEVSNLDYWERLSHLRLYSIERRFERYLIIYVWKIIKGIIDQPEPFDITDIDSRTGRKFSLYNQRKSNLSLKFCETPFNRARKAFNSLPSGLRNITSVNVDNFKHHLDKFLSKIPDEPNVPGYGKFRAATTNKIADQMAHLQSGVDHVEAAASALRREDSST